MQYNNFNSNCDYKTLTEIILRTSHAIQIGGRIEYNVWWCIHERVPWAYSNHGVLAIPSLGDNFSNAVSLPPIF